MHTKKRLRGAFLLIVLLLLLDQTTKWLTHSYIPLIAYSSSYPYGGYGVFRNFFGIEFSITHLTNQGAAWGMLADFQLYLLVLRILLICAVASYAFLFNKERTWLVPLALILAGAIGNVLDFFIYGHVVDMLKFVFWGYEYPVFNLADSAVCIGVIWIGWLNLKNGGKKALPVKRPYAS